MRRSVILDVSVGAVFHTVLLFSLFLLFAGHNAPGGGFVGGLVAGAALVLRYVQGGAAQVQKTLGIAPEAVLGLGLAVAAATAVAPLFFGGAFFESATLTRTIPVAGSVKFTSALVFDIGVYLVVVGLVLGAITYLGGDDE